MSDRQIQDCADTNPGGSSEDIEIHLDECESCLARLLQWQLTQFKKLGADTMKDGPYPGCPGDSVLQEVAAQIAPPEAATHCLEHAAQCDYCGPMLKRYLQEFSDELPLEIEAAIARSPISQPRWQRQKAREIVGHPPSPDPVSLWQQMRALFAMASFRAIAGTTAAVLVAAGGVHYVPVIINAREIANGNGLVAAAYAERRTIEPRFTNVNPAPYQQPIKTLGPGDPSDILNRPALSEAAAKAGRKTVSGAKVDARWFQIKGRLALLQNPDNTQEAEQAFQQAQQAGLNNLSLEIDMAVNSFVRESRADKPDMRKPIDQLNKVLSSSKPKPSPEEERVALFDLALAYEKGRDWGSAVLTWEKYLKLDTAGPWADEARRHLHESEPNVPRDQTHKDPAYFNQHFSDPDVSNDVEQWQEIALRSGLAEAVDDPMSEWGKATRNIAHLTAQQQHADPMWTDLVSAAEKADLPAMQALSDAFIANKDEEHKKAIAKSREAARIFAGRRNLPGELLARFEEIYALQRKLDADECLTRIDQLWPRVFATSYHWLQGQLALERATCANLAFKLQTAEKYLKDSRALADQFDFPELQLRIMGLGAGMKRLNFDYDGAWAEAVEGLNHYGRRAYSSERLYQFYSVMRLTATNMGFFYAAEAYLRRSIEILQEAAPNAHALNALLYMRLANLLWQDGREFAAETEAQHARQLLKSIPAGEETAPAYLALATIELADFELLRHSPERALATVQEIGDSLSTQDNFAQLDFYRVRGDANLQLHRLDDAALDYRRGISVAERSYRQAQDDEAGRLRWVEGTNRIYRGQVQILLAKQQDEKALAVWEWSKSRFLDHATHNGHLLDVATVADKIQLPPAVHPHVIYASFADRLQIWTVQGANRQSQSIALKQTDLLRMVRDFNQSCQSPASAQSEIENQATNLYGVLLQPVLAALGPSETVAIEFDDAIPAFSIEALRSPEGRYFGAAYAILRSPGMLAESALRRPVALEPQNPFLVVDVSPAKGNELLPGHLLPTAAIARIYTQRTVFTGPDISLPDVKQALRNSASFYIMSHGRRSNTGMALGLGPDSSFRAKDFSPELVRQLRLAVLAACSSGSAENGVLNPDSLVRPLLAGGVPNVIASHWYVDSAATGDFFASFYTNLGKGETTAQALRDARKKILSKPDLLSHNPDHSHPYYWAAFALTGRSN